MKLVELLSEEKIIIKEEAVDIPKLTTLSIDNLDYKWNGSTWVRATDNAPAKPSVVSRLTKSWKSINPPTAMFDPAKAAPVAVGDRYIVNLKDQNFSFAKQVDADTFTKRLRNGSSVTRALRGFEGAYREIGRSLYNKLKIGSVMTPEQISTAMKNRPTLTKIFAGPVMSGFFKLLGVLGIGIGLFQSFIINYDIVNEMPDSEFPGGQAEKEELKSIITGLFVSQCILMLSMAFRVIRIATLINLIRSPIRAMQIGAAATGAGTIPSLITMIITEAAFWGATYLLTRPAFQMKLAEFVAGTVAAKVFEGVGNVADLAALGLDTMTNGALGGSTLRDALTFEGGVTKMPTGTSYASSEWAKLAFQDMIFPPDMEKVKVPYLMLGDRTGAIFDALEIDPSERPAESIDPKPMSSGQLGQLSDYVFPYTPEMADQLKDTHELVAVSDRMGARPGGINQELYLAPTPEALRSGKPIPMPDNRVLTRTGAKIERPENSNDNDELIKRASDAIDSAENPVRTQNTGRSNSPVVPAARQGSGRSVGRPVNIRPGDEENALDAIAADRNRFN
jgi:hypothetical protein